MYLIEGSVTLTDDNGSAVTVNPGDTVFVAKGAPCAWSSVVIVPTGNVGTIKIKKPCAL